MPFVRGVLSALSTLALSAGIASASQAETAEEAAARFGERETVMDISLSPSGNRIAFVGAGPRGSEVLNVIDLAGNAEVKAIMASTAKNSDLTGATGRPRRTSSVPPTTSATMAAFWSASRASSRSESTVRKQ